MGLRCQRRSVKCPDAMDARPTQNTHFLSFGPPSKGSSKRFGHSPVAGMCTALRRVHCLRFAEPSNV